MKKKKPMYVVAKRFVDEGADGSQEDKLMCFGWENFLDKLKWNDL